MSSYICVLQHAFVFGSTQFYFGCLFWNPALVYKIQRHYRIGGLNPLRCAFVFWNPSLSFEILECVSNHFTKSSLVFWNPSLFFQLLVCVWNLGSKSLFVFWNPVLDYKIQRYYVLKYTYGYIIYTLYVVLGNTHTHTHTHLSLLLVERKYFLFLF